MPFLNFCRSEAMDPQHIARQEQLRYSDANAGAEKPLTASLLQISSSFIITIMGAVGGLAGQPLQSVLHNGDESFLVGVSKGIIGLVTKPVGAVAELVNQTGQGLLGRITGVHRIPTSELRMQRRALNKKVSHI